MILQVRQILDRAKQGVTQPFLCIADDDQTYFVKGAGAGLGSLVSEWVAGSLARRLGLPVPEFRMIEVDEDTLRYSALDNKRDLGAGVWFGYQRVDLGENLTWSQTTLVPRPLQAQVLLFDWWVANGDRALTDVGGNVNLLWTPLDRRLHLIDHNQAYDAHEIDRYMQTHVFRSAAAAWTQAFCAEQAERLRAAAEQLDVIWAELPEEWTTADCPVTLEEVRDLLWRFSTDPANFWRLP